MSNCVQQPSGNYCPPASNWKNCRPWDLSQDDKLSCYVDDLTQEALDIAGAQVNVHKLLGIHEQTRLTDLTGTGTPLSGGDAPNYPKSNAFTVYAQEWRSKQAGSAAILASSYIGYDFGVVKIPNGRNRYGPEAPIRHTITTIRIKQSTNPMQRVTRARIERSEDGSQWYGVAIVTLPNDDVLNTIHFKDTVPSRYWRIRPLTFVGGDCDSWAVQALEMSDYTLTHLSNIQDKILLENRDRDYSDAPITLKGYYELLNVQSDLTRFGIDISTQLTYQIRINFTSCVMRIGRPIVIGDILELPSEVQYTPELRPVKRYLEVTDVAWDPNSYTPGWRPTMLLITAQPALATQETQDIFGNLVQAVDNSGLFQKDDGNSTTYQDFSVIDQAIAAEAKTEVPLRGSEGSNTIREFTEEEKTEAAQVGFPHINRMGFNRTGLYVEDAIPQNGAPYTEGDVFPQSPKDGDYHRMIYVGLAKDVPAQLYRWSTAKGRWIYLETDRRKQFDDQKPILQEYTTSSYKRWAREVK